MLQKLSISAVGKREKLLRVIKNPVSQYLPINSYRIGFSHSSEKLVDAGDYVNAVSDDVNLVFVVGAMAHGKIEKEFVDDFISISGYPLSAAYCIQGSPMLWRKSGKFCKRQGCLQVNGGLGSFIF